MRIETITRKLFYFDELSDSAKEKAIEKLWDLNVEYNWWNSTYDDAESIGIRIHSFNIDRGSYCKGEFLESAESCAHLIINEHGDTCETYKTAEQYLADRDNLIKTWPKNEDCEFEDEYSLDRALDELDDSFKYDILEDCRIILQREYEYLTSKESIIEAIQANEYEFLEDGSMA